MNRHPRPLELPVEADLARRDLLLLMELCAGKKVVEFGSGGSTLFLAHVAADVVSYDTHAGWSKKIAARIEKERKSWELAPVRLLTGPFPEKLPTGDVHFVDGKTELRPSWVHRWLTQRAAPVAIIHDSRRLLPLEQCKLLLKWPHTAWIDRIEFHAGGSNCVVVRLRGSPVKYENWNQTEPQNRRKIPFV